MQTMCRQRRLCMAGCHRRRGVAHLLAVGLSACPKPGLMSMMEVTHTHAHKCCLGRALGSTIIMALAEAVEVAVEWWLSLGQGSMMMLLLLPLVVLLVMVMLAVVVVAAVALPWLRLLQWCALEAHQQDSTSCSRERGSEIEDKAQR